jgi:hypothetical protein
MVPANVFVTILAIRTMISTKSFEAACEPLKGSQYHSLSLRIRDKLHSGMHVARYALIRCP